MPLDPQAQQLLDKAKTAMAELPPITKITPEQARARMAKALTFPGEAVARVEDLWIQAPAGKLRVRHYRPSQETILPGVVFFHGGGWMLNSVETHDHLCRALCNKSGCAIFSVDYRLAPENPFPAAIDDAWTATEWISKNSVDLGVNRIAVAGDSSGGAQAAVVAQLALEKNIHLVCQVLLYPVVDHWSLEAASYTEMASGYSLTRELMIYFWQNYLTDQSSLDDPRVCPSRAKNFSGLPPALVITAEFDPLRDEAEDYAKKLALAGVAVQKTRYSGMMHGFAIQFPLLEKGRDSLDETAGFIRAHMW